MWSGTRELARQPRAAKSARSDTISTRVRFAYPPELLHTALIYTLSKEFELVTSTHRANVGDAESWVEMELVGAPMAIAAGVDWLLHRGVHVAPVEVPPAVSGVDRESVT
jgi:hypothetical protein